MRQLFFYVCALLCMAGCGSPLQNSMRSPEGISSGHASEVEHDGALINCESLTACLDYLDVIEIGKYGLSKEEQAFAESFTRFGEPALIELLQRLGIGGNRAKIVGYAISSFDPIDEKYLPQIVQGVESDVSWLARALGNIPTDKGAKAAVEAYLVSDSAPRNQEAHAVVKQGKRAVPFILNSMQCGEYCQDVRQGLLVHIVGEFDDSAKVFAATEIVDKLNNSSISRANKANLLGLFFNLGAVGVIAEKDLEELWQGEPKLRDTIDRAFVGMGSKHVGRIFRQAIEEQPENYELFRMVSKFGPLAQEAAPSILNAMRSSRGEHHIYAVLALGFLKYAPAEPQLVAAVDDLTSPRQNWVAVNALGRLGLRTSLQHLDRIAKEHWYPPVREEAALAAENIRKGAPHESPIYKNDRGFNFLAFKFVSYPNCEVTTVKPAVIDPSRKLHWRKNEEQLQSLSYDSVVIGYGAADEAQQKADDPDGIIRIDSGNMMEIREKVVKNPSVALKTPKGWLAGYDGGEWSGELMYLANDGQSTKLIDGNIQDLFSFKGFSVALSGMAHLSINTGSVYKVERSEDSWEANLWIDLPGAPDRSWLTEAGDIYIDTYRGGSILLSQDGSLKMAPCEKYEDKDN